MNRFLLLLLCLLSSLTTDATIAQTRLANFTLPPGFIAEEIYEVPNSQQGSWICLTVDDRGRLIASDQKGAIYRLTLAESAGVDSPIIEKIDLDIGMAMGLLYQSEALYVMVNGKSAQGPGLYRVRDTDQDDKFDSIELLRGIEPPGKPGAGHGNHAIVPSPDGKSLYVVCGNMAGKPVGGFDSSRVPKHWEEDQLLPRMPDSRGHANNTMAPGGWIAKTDLDGRHWELICIGFRNVYDAAFNRDGDLFTYDADMEFDLGTPWYRPTRICHVTSGGEFGWRNGSGKWPAYYPDSLPSAIDVGLGSPTGVTFGYTTNFPAPYRDAFFFCDWSYGRIYTANLERNGASYSGSHQLFASFAPLPVVDIVVHPLDHSLYLVTGGRGVQSHVYRIRYDAGRDDIKTSIIASPKRDSKTDSLHSLRRSLEAMHQPMDLNRVDQIWPHLKHPDRHIRYAARVALEHQPVDQWQDRLSAETAPQTIVEATIALARCTENRTQALLQKLEEVQLEHLDRSLQLDLLRAYALVFIRHGGEKEMLASQLGQQCLALFPTNDTSLDRELGRILAFLRTDGSIEPMLKALETAESSDDQMHFALMLRGFDQGWSIDQRRRYFGWFERANAFTGGRTNGEFARQIRQEAEATLNNQEQSKLKSLLKKLNQPVSQNTTAHSRPMVKQWTVSDLLPDRDSSSPDRDFSWKKIRSEARTPNRGEHFFAVAMCNRCHQVGSQGGRVGPNLSGVTRRFSPYDLLEAIIEPNKTIPHEFQAVKVVTDDGKVVVGQVVNYGGGGMSVRTNQMEPWKLTKIQEESIEQISPSTTSLMPAGLLDTLNRQEIIDLLGWLAER